MAKLATAEEIRRGPLTLLKQVRGVMAAPYSAQMRLDTLVRLIAQGFDCQVCSIYLQRAGEVLELYASYGLNQDAVHATRLVAGEGLVGVVARTGQVLNLAEAREHPQFSYRPETGEDLVRSFIAVPVLSGGRVVGVLVVQSAVAEAFSDEQLEVLQTIAMVLAELHASGALVSLNELRSGGETGLSTQHLTGLRLSPGLAQGAAVLHHPRIVVTQVMAEDPNREVERLNHALSNLRASVDMLIQNAAFESGDERADIMETYRMFTEDKGWIRQIVEAIHTGLTAEGAVQRVQERLRARLEEVESQYIRERVQDLEDLSTRLLQHLTGHTSPADKALPAKFILVAQRIGPAELLEYGRDRLKGIVLEEGSATSHIVIIARSMDIPIVGRIPQAMQLVRERDKVIVDGDRGEIFIRPYEEVARAFRDQIRAKRRQTAVYNKLRDLPAETRDGVRISLNINSGLYAEASELAEEGVDGVGLYRTELPYMISQELPDADSQTRIYAEILSKAGDKRVVFRTFDIGGDKQLPYFPTGDEENPAMGWRATRIAIDRPNILRKQCRALLRATAGRELQVMFPFITLVSEFTRARELFEREVEHFQDTGQPLPETIRYGCMLEIPALLWQLPELLKEVSFVSVGSNDLFQFLFASDRNSQALAGRYDELSPVVLRLLFDLICQCREAGVDLRFCGDMARKPLEAMVLLGLGIRNLSVPASAIGPLKAMARSIDLGILAEYLGTLMHATKPSLRSELATFARDHGVAV